MSLSVIYLSLNLFLLIRLFFILKFISLLSLFSIFFLLDFLRILISLFISILYTTLFSFSFFSISNKSFSILFLDLIIKFWILLIIFLTEVNSSFVVISLCGSIFFLFFSFNFCSFLIVFSFKFNLFISWFNSWLISVIFIFSIPLLILIKLFFIILELLYLLEFWIFIFPLIFSSVSLKSIISLPLLIIWLLLIFISFFTLTGLYIISEFGLLFSCSFRFNILFVFGKFFSLFFPSLHWRIFNSLECSSFIKYFFSSFNSFKLVSLLFSGDLTLWLKPILILFSIIKLFLFSLELLIPSLFFNSFFTILSFSNLIIFFPFLISFILFNFSMW